jgi:ferredoxin
VSKITVDESLCTGCGLCAANCPDVFEMGDDNLAHVVAGECNSCALSEIAEQCPVSAIAAK